MTCPDCFADMHGVQYQGTSEDYDGISEHQCPGCGLRIGRWSGKRLKAGEIEGRYGRRVREPADQLPAPPETP